MFDLITQDTERPLRERSPLSKLVALVMHVTVVAVVVVLPLLRATDALPEAPAMMAFVAPPPAPPPPPPPPAPAVAERAMARPVRTAGKFAAPIEAPNEVQPDRGAGKTEALLGIEGGVEGGVAGGTVGGIVGGLVSPAPPPPPPPPPAPTPRAPVRIGGQLSAPALVRRVEPSYPDIAAALQLSGMVILEAVVDTQGRVESVKVLRSRHALLDRAATEALQQWQYSPLFLNGIPTSFVLTVTFTFSVGR